MMDSVRITFGIIVLNGEPFTKYCLRHLYPYAHEIIVVEGGSRNAVDIAPEGHSVDGTLKTLYEFKENEDPEDKVRVITKSGFWSGKDEQSQAYATRASGDWLWQVDIDEFYTEDNLERIVGMLQSQPDTTSLSFRTVTFWGDLHTVVNGWSLIRGREIYHRLFKWGPGYSYATHRPPTVCDEKGVDLRTKKYLDGRFLFEKHGIFMNHYSLLFPRQVMAKARYYARWARPDSVTWAEENYLQLRNVFRVHNVYEYPSWLERYHGSHNRHAVQMFQDVATTCPEELRDMSDVRTLLRNPIYKIRRAFVQHGEIFDRLLNRMMHVTRIVIAELRQRCFGRLP